MPGLGFRCFGLRVPNSDIGEAVHNDYAADFDPDAALDGYPGTQCHQRQADVVGLFGKEFPVCLIKIWDFFIYHDLVLFVVDIVVC